MIENVGIIGAGQMGGGIAHVVSLSGRKVYLLDIDQGLLTGSIQTIEKNMARQASRGKVSEDDVKAALSRIETGTDYSGFSNCDIVIEAATENEDVKRKIFEEILGFLSAHALLATNTSSISITRLASTTDRPEKFIGMHFFNPVPVMQLVELIKGIATSQETFQTAKALSESLGKTVAEAEDFPAFIVNRILVPMINEAVYAVYEGVGTISSVDIGLGPLQLADFIGLDTCLSVMQVMYAGLADPKYRPCPLLVKYVEAGWLGKKAGKGFYDYSGDEPVPTR